MALGRESQDVNLCRICRPAITNVMDGMTVLQDYFILKMLHLLKRTEIKFAPPFSEAESPHLCTFCKHAKYEDMNLVKDDPNPLSTVESFPFYNN